MKKIDFFEYKEQINAFRTLIDYYDEKGEYDTANMLKEDATELKTKWRKQKESE